MQSNLPDAVLCISDEQAIGILHSAQDAGVKVPEDLQIISFNNTRLVEMGEDHSYLVLFNHCMILVLLE